MNIRTITAVAAAFLGFVAVEAKVRLPHLISDNMIIQQQSDVRLWGWDNPGTTVRVTTSWSSDVATAKAGNDGLWLVTVRSPRASYTPLSICFDDGERTEVNGVLAGEVWVCAGQSNMEMPIKGFWQCPVEGYNECVVESARHSAVHSVKIPSTMRSEPQDDAPCQWRVCGPGTVGDFSATGYFFARVLHQALDIPVGLIEANKGGSRVESWLTKENLQRYTSDPTDSVEIARRWPMDYHRSLLWGNGTFHPILRYTVKGILFYQGCSNVGDPGDQYSERLKLLVEQWRQQFGLGPIPFYYVQIAPYINGDVNGDWGPRLREQQFKAQAIIPNSSLVCTNDLVYPYEFTQIHPTQKRQVGERLAWTALNRDYGFEGILYKSSSFKDMKIEGDAVYIHLQDNYHSDAPFEDIRGFEVAGADRVFHPARAQHFWREGGGYWDEAIKVTCPEVKDPVAVRYCFRNFQLGNVINGANLPLFPFRTDNW
jgi:sialate O-acetylesterase